MENQSSWRKTRVTWWICQHRSFREKGIRIDAWHKCLFGTPRVFTFVRFSDIINPRLHFSITTSLSVLYCVPRSKAPTVLKSMWNVFSEIALYDPNFTGKRLDGEPIELTKDTRHLMNMPTQIIQGKKNDCDLLNNKLHITCIVVIEIVHWTSRECYVCLYNYEFWLSLCKIVRSSGILLLPLWLPINNSPRVLPSGVEMNT
jgi:hypothetical protein